jgi:competence protein ComEA
MHPNLSRFAACLLVFSVLAIATASPWVAATEAPRVDINKADVQQLATLPGIGEAIAQRIVDFREEHGPFRRVEDLMKVKGIGEKSLEKIRPHVSVGPSK